MSFLNTIAACSRMANENYDGHFTLLKFTTNWRCCFGTPSEINHNFTAEMAEGKTPDEAMAKAMEKNINSFDIEEKLDSEW